MIKVFGMRKMRVGRRRLKSTSHVPLTLPSRSLLDPVKGLCSRLFFACGNEHALAVCVCGGRWIRSQNRFFGQELSIHQRRPRKHMWSSRHHHANQHMASESTRGCTRQLRQPPGQNRARKDRTMRRLQGVIFPHAERMAKWGKRRLGPSRQHRLQMRERADRAIFKIGDTISRTDF